LDVHIESKGLAIGEELMNFVFFGKKDTVNVHRRMIALRSSIRLRFSKNISVDFGLGRLVYLYKEDIADSLNIFNTKLGNYLSFNTKYFSIPAYLNDGIGLRFNLKELQPILLPLSVEWMRYRHHQYSFSLSGNFELSSGGWFITVFTAFSLSWWLHAMS
jgi:hypothetical protein